MFHEVKEKITLQWEDSTIHRILRNIFSLVHKCVAFVTWGRTTLCTKFTSYISCAEWRVFFSNASFRLINCSLERCAETFCAGSNNSMKNTVWISPNTVNTCPSQWILFRLIYWWWHLISLRLYFCKESIFHRQSRYCPKMYFYLFSKRKKIV